MISRPATRAAVREAAWLAISATPTLSLRKKRVNRTSCARFPARRRMHEQGRRTRAACNDAPLFPGDDRQIVPVQLPSTEDLTSIQDHRTSTDAWETKLRNIPLAVSEVIQEFALGLVGIDFECQIERSARSNNPKILIEHNERFSNRVDDSVRKYPGILDLGELFSEHVSEHEHGDTL